ncbi:hypothetical protein KKB99_01480, partial [bacterium]|nr:hypothetical protein [bacterium]MBU1024657.1 hypothetical protein [bacterium]
MLGILHRNEIKPDRRATDDKCLSDASTLLIVFYNDGSHRYVTPPVVDGWMSPDHRAMSQTFEFNTPNIFAC